jgi:hypothetical protein
MYSSILQAGAFQINYYYFLFVFIEIFIDTGGCCVIDGGDHVLG